MAYSELVVGESDHPRIRGEHSSTYGPPTAGTGSSPHTRGAPARIPRSARLWRIIPAYAGSTGPGVFDPPRGWDHPRIRGEHPRAPVTIVHGAGSSPHTRGARRRHRHRNSRSRIIPAYAGSTPTTSSRCPPNTDHPRIRGEHATGVGLVDRCAGSSPHTRGALDEIIVDPDVIGIIPAYAGSTPCTRRPSESLPDHPRIRGEHVRDVPPTNAVTGSSPHTRGALLEIPAIPRIAAVIIPVFLYPSPTPQEEADRSMVLLTLS